MSNSKTTPATFPQDFIFGVATAAYQIEGAANMDGRGPSIWDDFSHSPGNVINNDNGDVACDHYKRWEADLDLIKALNVDAYRFSFSWSRVLPNGTGQINEKGLAFYDRLIDGCLQRGLKPFATLYHWDLPSTLQASGGWTHRDTASAFADYAALMVDRFGDRLASVSTFNEPWCSSILGYLEGIHAPGIKDITLAMKTIHHQHLGHGLAVSQIKSIKPDLPVGIVLNLQSIYPGSNSEENKAAAKRHEEFNNGSFLDPLFKGHYPESVVGALGQNLPEAWRDDLSTIHQPLDFWGLNYYTPARVVAATQPTTVFPHTAQAVSDTPCDRTDIGWEIDASTFEDLILDVYKKYDLPPCYITENGACFNDEPVDGVVDDGRRVNYLNDHIQAVANASKAGIALRGYFAWSLMDNFEWAEGYSMRFGLVHVDYRTQQRTVKKSGQWYAELAHSHRLART